MPEIPANAQRSPDGHYWWDGAQWQPVDQSGAAASSAAPASASASSPIPADAQRSPDGQYWWDGSEWQPVNPSGEHGQQGGQGQQGEHQGQALSDDQFAQMLQAAESDVAEV